MSTNSYINSYTRLFLAPTILSNTDFSLQRSHKSKSVPQNSKLAYLDQLLRQLFLFPVLQFLSYTIQQLVPFVLLKKEVSPLFS